MFRLTSLSTKIILMALLLALIPLIITYFVASSLFTDTLINNIQQNLTAQAVQAGHSIDQFFHQRITDIKMLSQADLLEENDADKINQYLEEIQIENNLLHDIYVVSPTGEFIAAAKDKDKISKNIQSLNLSILTHLFDKSLMSGQGDVLVSEALEFDSGLKVVLMTPITDDANINVIKVLIVELDLKAAERIVANFGHSIIGDKSVYIVDNDGLVIVTPNKETQLLQPFKDLKVNPDLLDAFSNQGEDGSVMYIDSDNDHVVAGFADMDEFGVNQALDWSIIGLAPVRDIAAPVYSLRNFLILLIAALTLVTGLAAVLVGRSISKPILKIINIITDMSNGNLNTEITLAEKGEIGQLSDSIRKMQRNIRDTTNAAENIAEGNLDVNINVLSEQDILGKSLSSMVNRLREMRDEQMQQDWLKTGLNELNDKVSGEQDLTVLSENVINFLTPYLDAQVGAFYLFTKDEKEKTSYLKMTASHAYVWRKQVNNKIQLTEGLVGQAAYERKPIVLTEVDADYIRVGSGLGELSAASVLVSPFTYEGQLKGVVEFATLKRFTQLHLDFLNQAMSTLGIAVNTAESRTQMQSLLNNSQQQTSELEDQSHQMLNQQHELQRVNEELQAQSEELQTQQEELREANEQLELRTQDLEQQKEEIRKKNDVLKTTQKEIERKAHELEVSGRYKSEFLANMSHELRTPLNAIMILSQILAENEEGNLTEEQADYMQTIYSAGADLLDLINEILDLSKVEAGKVEIQPENFSLRELIDKSIDSKFRAVATKKGITFDIDINSRVPETIYSGVLRVKQVLNNLLSNAFKFTQQGGIKLVVDYQPTDHFKDNKLYIAIQVIDTGIGIAPDKFQVIFEAFQQADGSTSRKYGGTGLGLSISRQLARLLGGDITVESAENQGATFTFYLPPLIPDTHVEDNKIIEVDHSTPPTEKTIDVKPILLITDNPQWVEQLNQCFEQCENIEFMIITHQEHAITQLKQSTYYCIILDSDSISLGEISLFDYLAQDEQLSKIPAIVYSSSQLSDSVQQAIQYPNLTIQFIDSFETLAEQAQQCFAKATEKGVQTQSIKNKQDALINKKVLLVDDDVRNTFALKTFLQHKEMHIIIAHDGVEALSLLEVNPDVDIVLMDIMMPEMDGYEAMRKIRDIPQFKKLPIIALTAKAMKDDKNKCIDAGASDYLTKPIDMEKLISVMQVWLYQ
ncbi:response regulator [Candidatus Albibeggiatoa sp. nov. NOAA]|uniref:response regulator n=1 Tax=Candidatus Albibeggiatoa sp. nov. NOAA TaxID=3162724 RepID=UPI003303A5A7|nr:response regulator [Thiotrichaceae bacterium]